MKMILGVQDILYGHAHGDGGDPNTTTGDVAQFLEAKYSVMEEFYKLHENDVVEILSDSIGDAVADCLAGMSFDIDNISDEISGEIKKLFQAAILNKEFDGKIDGVATQASLDGVSHRKKKGFHQKKERRASFLDTYSYCSSFKVWIE